MQIFPLIDPHAVRQDGTTPLTGNWAVGGFDITGVGNLQAETFNTDPDEDTETHWSFDGGELEGTRITDAGAVVFTGRRKRDTADYWLETDDVITNLIGKAWNGTDYTTIGSLRFLAESLHTSSTDLPAYMDIRLVPDGSGTLATALKLSSNALTLGNSGSAADTRVNFESSGNDGSIDWDQDALKFVFNWGMSADGGVTFNVDPVNHRVGIGTATPGALLDVAKDSWFGTDTVGDAVEGYSLYVKRNADTEGDYYLRLYIDAGKDAHIYSNSVYFAIQSTGAIDIKGGDADDYIRIFTSGGEPRITTIGDNDLNLYASSGIVNVHGGMEIGDGGTTNYAAFSATGDLSFVGTARIGWTKITANGATIRNAHGTTASSVSDLQTAHDSNTYTLVEEAETPGMDIEVDFTGVTAFNWVQILAWYKGNSGHGMTVQLEITPFNGSAWHTYDFIPDETAEQTFENYSFFVPDDSAYINSGVVKVRFVHEMAGTASHEFYVDICALYQ